MQLNYFVDVQLPLENLWLMRITNVLSAIIIVRDLCFM
jgi:hypothetical protein